MRLNSALDLLKFKLELLDLEVWIKGSLLVDFELFLHMFYFLMILDKLLFQFRFLTEKVDVAFILAEEAILHVSLRVYVEFELFLSGV